MDTMDRLKKLFIDKIDIQEKFLKPEVTLDSLGLDSLDKVEFLFSLEEEFHVKIDDRAKTINTIQDVVDLVDTVVAEQRPAVRA